MIWKQVSFLNETELISLHTDGFKYSYVIHSFICTQLNGFKYSKELNTSIWPIDRTLTYTTTPSQSGPGSNGNKVVLHVSYCSIAITLRSTLAQTAAALEYADCTLTGAKYLG